MQLRNSLPEIPSGWVHQHSSISVFFSSGLQHRIIVNCYNSKVISHGIIHKVKWICTYILSTLFHFLTAIRSFLLLGTKQKASDTAVSIRPSFSYNPSQTLSLIFAVLWYQVQDNMITSNLSFRLWYILWNPRWKATPPGMYGIFFFGVQGQYHCKIVHLLIIVCTDVLFMCFAIAKVGLSRKEIILKHMLGEGFFGEVYEGVYQKKASSTRHCSHVMMQWKLKCFCRSNLDFPFTVHLA